MRLGVVRGPDGGAGEHRVAGRSAAQHRHLTQVPGLEPGVRRRAGVDAADAGRRRRLEPGATCGRTRALPGEPGGVEEGDHRVLPGRGTRRCCPGGPDPARAGARVEPPSSRVRAPSGGRHAGPRARHAGHSHRATAALLASRGQRAAGLGHGAPAWRTPSTAPAAVPVVFVHGLWLHATSWTPWVELFRRPRLRARSPPAGPATRPPAAGTRADPDAVAGYGIGDVTDHYWRHRGAVRAAGGDRPLLRRADRPGLHGMGLGPGLRRACQPASSRGTSGATSGPAAERPGRCCPTRVCGHEDVVALAGQFRAGPFANAVPRAESDQLLATTARCRPGPAALPGERRELRCCTARRRWTRSGSAGRCC